MTSAPASFSKPLAVDDISPSGVTARLEADEPQRAQIAARLGIPAVVRLSGEVALHPTEDGVLLRGRLDAILSRLCVASLEPMEEVLGEDFEIRFARGAAAERDDLDADITPDTPEPLEGDLIDVAEILVQQLALSMASYPRKDDAAPLIEQHGATGGPTSPFAALKGVFAGRRDKE